MAISVAYVNDLLRDDKTVISRMSWAKKLFSSDPGWYQYTSAVRLGDEIPEGFKIICQWRPAVGAKPQVINLGLYLSGQRIYAIDVQPADKHKNNGAGRGRPYYKQLISGIHEHLWSDDPPYQGYAEPLQEKNIEQIETAWQIFLLRANLNYPFEFIHPDRAINQGQGELKL